jgi:hypothetical protein
MMKITYEIFFRKEFRTEQGKWGQQHALPYLLPLGGIIPHEYSTVHTHTLR